ncbi:hypothetical protein ASC71_18710 [Rhizobium sp. Root1240]|nr:hypothetical protein ASC71_18710 [Rhizobium sp. Root1240]
MNLLTDLRLGRSGWTSLNQRSMELKAYRAEKRREALSPPMARQSDEEHMPEERDFRHSGGGREAILRDGPAAST